MNRIKSKFSVGFIDQHVYLDIEKKGRRVQASIVAIFLVSFVASAILLFSDVYIYEKFIWEVLSLCHTTLTSQPTG